MSTGETLGRCTVVIRISHQLCGSDGAHSPFAGPGARVTVMTSDAIFLSFSLPLFKVPETSPEFCNDILSYLSCTCCNYCATLLFLPHVIWEVALPVSLWFFLFAEPFITFILFPFFLEPVWRSLYYSLMHYMFSRYFTTYLCFLISLFLLH